MEREPSPLTYTARRNLVTELAPLSLWLAHKLWREGQSDIYDALTRRTNLYRLTVLWDGVNHPARSNVRDDRWDALVRELAVLFERYQTTHDTSALEATGMGILWPLMEGRIANDVEAWPRPSERPFGFFSYNKAPSPSSGDGEIRLHMANPFVPRSPFQDVGARKAELLSLLQDVHRLHPSLQIVTSSTWMNQLPAFMALFPPEWAKSATQPLKLGMHFGWWGQMINRTGGFHDRNGMSLRKTRRFPFQCVTCHCTIVQLEAHLARP